MATDTRGAACSNSRPQAGVKSFGGLEGGGVLEFEQAAPLALVIVVGGTLASLGVCEMAPSRCRLVPLCYTHHTVVHAAIKGHGVRVGVGVGDG